MAAEIIIHEENGSHSRVIDQTAANKVLYSFNPSGDDRVSFIKLACAGLIQEMLDLQDEEDTTPAQKRTAAMAISDLEKVQMLCVKALFAKA